MLGSYWLFCVLGVIAAIALVQRRRRQRQRRRTRDVAVVADGNGVVVRLTAEQEAQLRVSPQIAGAFLCSGVLPDGVRIFSPDDPTTYMPTSIERNAMPRQQVAFVPVGCDGTSSRHLSLMLTQAELANCRESPGAAGAFLADHLGRDGHVFSWDDADRYVSTSGLHAYDGPILAPDCELAPGMPMASGIDTSDASGTMISYGSCLSETSSFTSAASLADGDAFMSPHDHSSFSGW